MWPGFDSRTRRHVWDEFVLVLGPSPRIFLRVLRFSSLSKNRHAAYSSWLLDVLHGHAWTVQRLPEGAYICCRSDLVELRPCCLARAISEAVIVTVIETLLIQKIRFSHKMPMMPQGSYFGHR